MKYLIIFVLCQVFILKVTAQDFKRPYARQHNYLVELLQDQVNSESKSMALEPSSVAIETSYYDGLGRLIQKVSRKSSFGSLDLVSQVGYDKKGRIKKQYLPYSHGTDGNFKRYAINNNGYTNSDQFLFYQNADDHTSDEKPYSETIYEASPLNRPLKQGAPGSAWQPDPDANITTDNVIHYSYEVSTLTDNVYIWDIDLITADLTATGHYPNGQLTKTMTTDEAGHAVIEFVDKLGQTILKRVQAVEAPNMTTYTAGDWADTYYVYDDFGNLRYVLPPEAVKEISSPSFPYTPSP
ncbi:MAG: DUF6443 domain-containing protein, partial [Bacteroidota bacterium]